MREDFHKILCERPRIGHANPHYVKQDRKAMQKEIVDPDLRPRRQGMARVASRGYGRKELNENLKPLEKFLLSRLGKHWDKVYAEIRNEIDARSAVQAHILQHLAHMVELNVMEVGHGKFLNSKGEDILCDFFVHPKTKQLKSNPRWNYRIQLRRNYQQPKAPYVKIDGVIYAEIKEIWYELLFQEIPRPAINPMASNSRYLPATGFWDVFHRDVVTFTTAAKLWGTPVHCYAKRQLNTKEIKRLKEKLDERVEQGSVR